MTRRSLVGMIAATVAGLWVGKRAPASHHAIRWQVCSRRANNQSLMVQCFGSASGGIIPNDGKVANLHGCDFPIPRKIADQIKRSCVGADGTVSLSHPAVKDVISYDYKFHGGVLTFVERT